MSSEFYLANIYLRKLNRQIDKSVLVKELKVNESTCRRQKTRLSYIFNYFHADVPSDVWTLAPK